MAKSKVDKAQEPIEPEIKERNKIGRPSIYCDDLAKEILSRLSEGESLAKICQDDNMPTRSTIYCWCYDHTGFSDRYTIARAMQIDNKIDGMLDRIEDIPNKYSYTDEFGNKKIDSAGVNVERLYQDSLKWCAIKLVPKKYDAKSDDTNNKQPINIHLHKSDEKL